MLEVMQTALNGLRGAEARAYQAATNIAQLRVTEDGAAPSTTVSGPAPGESPVTGGGGHPNAEGRDYATAGQRDLAVDLIELKMAQHSYAANLAVLSTADRAMKHLLDRFS
jgi:hypothetical protein